MYQVLFDAVVRFDTLGGEWGRNGERRATPELERVLALLPGRAPEHRVPGAAQASENVDLSPNEEPQQQPVDQEVENNQTEETKPSIKRDDDDGDKIKFKR